MKEILKDLVERLTSRTFLVLVGSMVLLVMNQIGLDEFLAINGVSYVGTGAKDLIAAKTNAPKS